MRQDRGQALFQFRALHELHGSTPPLLARQPPGARAPDAAGPSGGGSSSGAAATPDTAASLSESELYLDDHIELLRAIEMSKLDFFRQTGQLPPEESQPSMPTSIAPSALSVLYILYILMLWLISNYEYNYEWGIS